MLHRRDHNRRGCRPCRSPSPPIPDHAQCPFPSGDHRPGRRSRQRRCWHLHRGVDDQFHDVLPSRVEQLCHRTEFTSWVADTPFTRHQHSGSRGTAHSRFTRNRPAYLSITVIGHDRLASLSHRRWRSLTSDMRWSSKPADQPSDPRHHQCSPTPQGRVTPGPTFEVVPDVVDFEVAVPRLMSGVS